MFDELKEVKYFNEITNFKTLEMKCLESLQVKTEAHLEPKASIYDGTFFVDIFNGLLFLQQKLDHRCLTMLCIGHQKY